MGTVARPKLNDSRRHLLTGLTALMLAVFPIQSLQALDPVFDIIDAEIRSSTPKSQEAVKKAIVAGGKARKWRMFEMGRGHLEAQVTVRSHVARVDIFFTEYNYSIIYKDSVNLKYKNGLIHKSYNKWIRNLDLDIQKSLSF